MAFVCPSCAKPTLEIMLSIDLPPDNRSDEIQLQSLHCLECGFESPGVYQESRRGALDSECWEHYGYRLTPQEMSVLKQLLLACPEREQSKCQCQSHQRLNAIDAQGRWQGFGNGYDYFPMTLKA